MANKAAKIAYAERFANIISDAQPEMIIFNFSGCIVVPADAKERRAALKQQNEELFGTSIVSTLDVMRKNGMLVKWIFDNVQDVSERQKTEGWALECFLGLQYTRLFCWLAAARVTYEPEFVRPGSHFLLEVADFVSYCVARDFERAVIGAPSEFPSSLLGEVVYQGTYATGSMEVIRQAGLPLKKFYNLEPIPRSAA